MRDRELVRGSLGLRAIIYSRLRWLPYSWSIYRATQKQVLKAARLDKSTRDYMIIADWYQNFPIYRVMSP